MEGQDIEDVKLLVEVLEKHPLDNLSRIAELENISYSRLRKVYMAHYKKDVLVSANYDLTKIGIVSYVAFLGLSGEEMVRAVADLEKNPFVVYMNSVFGGMNGLSLVIHVPVEQRKYVGKFLSKYTSRYKYYLARSLRSEEEPRFGKWDMSYDYARLMDILKINARTPVSKITSNLNKTRPTVRYMIKRLMERGIITGFSATIDVDVHESAILGVSKKFPERVLEKYKSYETLVLKLPGVGYMTWVFLSKEDNAGYKMIELGKYFDQIMLEHFKPFREINDRKLGTRFSTMVKPDGSGYRSILEFT